MQNPLLDSAASPTSPESLGGGGKQNRSFTKKLSATPKHKGNSTGGGGGGSSYTSTPKVMSTSTTSHRNSTNGAAVSHSAADDHDDLLYSLGPSMATVAVSSNSHSISHTPHTAQKQQRGDAAGPSSPSNPIAVNLQQMMMSSPRLPHPSSQQQQTSNTTAMQPKSSSEAKSASVPLFYDDGMMSSKHPPSDDLDALLLGTTSTMGRGGGGSGDLGGPSHLVVSYSTSSQQRSPQDQQAQRDFRSEVSGLIDPSSSSERQNKKKNASAALAARQYSTESDVCCDEVTRHHLCCFPCAMDTLYHSINDPGFCPSCSVCMQMGLFVVVPPAYYLCCCAQAYAVRGKFNVIINDVERNEGHGCSSLFYPCVVTAQVHREIEIRGKHVINSGCCGGSGEERVYRGEVYAPSMPDMIGDGRRLPYLSTQPPFAGGAISHDESLSMARNALVSNASIVLPIASDHECCGKPVVYNTWRHWVVLCLGLPGDLCCGVLTVFNVFTGGT